MKRGDDEATENSLIAAITAWPSDAHAYSDLGSFYQLHAEPEVAIKCYKRLLTIAPRFPHVYCRMAEAARDSGLLRDAISYGNKELTLDPKCVRALNVIAVIKLESGDTHAAEVASKRAYRADPDDERTIDLYTQTFMTSNPDGAAAVLRKAQKLLPNSEAIALRLGWCESHSPSDPQGESKALVTLRRAAALRPTDGVAHMEICRILLQQNQLPEAVKEGALAVRYSPHSPQAYFQYEQSLTRAGQKAEAAIVQKRFTVLQAAADQREEMKRRFSLEPSNPVVAEALASAQETLGDVHGAMITVEMGLAHNPHDVALNKTFNRLLQMGMSP